MRTVDDAVSRPRARKEGRGHKKGGQGTHGPKMQSRQQIPPHNTTAPRVITLADAATMSPAEAAHSLQQCFEFAAQLFHSVACFRQHRGPGRTCHATASVTHVSGV